MRHGAALPLAKGRGEWMSFDIYVDVDKHPHPMSQTLRILVVGDDADERRALRDYFEQQRLYVMCAASYRDVQGATFSFEPDLIVLDIPVGLDGRWVREIQSRSDVPIVLTLGHQCSELERIIGLELGADDCLTQPYSLPELLARIRAILRRREIARARIAEQLTARARSGKVEAGGQSNRP